MARKNCTAEQIIGMWRKAEVRFSRGEAAGHEAVEFTDRHGPVLDRQGPQQFFQTVEPFAMSRTCCMPCSVRKPDIIRSPDR